MYSSSPHTTEQAQEATFIQSIRIIGKLFLPIGDLVGSIIGCMLGTYDGAIVGGRIAHEQKRVAIKINDIDDVL